jgi:hypothetical protein
VRHSSHPSCEHGIEGSHWQWQLYCADRAEADPRLRNGILGRVQHRGNRPGAGAVICGLFVSSQNWPGGGSVDSGPPADLGGSCAAVEISDYAASKPRALAIRELLTRFDLSNTQWQLDHGMGNEKMSQRHSDETVLCSSACEQTALELNALWPDARSRGRVICNSNSDRVSKSIKAIKSGQLWTDWPRVATSLRRTRALPSQRPALGDCEASYDAADRRHTGSRGGDSDYRWRGEHVHSDTARHGLASPTFLQYTGPNGAVQARMEMAKVPVFTVLVMVRRCSLMCGLPASHGENRGSSPLGSANDFK